MRLPAKKRRRRRNDEESTDDAPPEGDSLLQEGELPDFDLDSPDAYDKDEQSSPRRANVIPDEITPLMMGDANRAVRSVNELISDRSLENKFEFEEKGDPSVPDFTELARASTSLSSTSSPSSSLDDAVSLGKKKQRQAERRANAVKTKEEEPQENPLSNVPFLTNEAGKFSAIKLLESGGK